MLPYFSKIFSIEEVVRSVGAEVYPPRPFGNHPDLEGILVGGGDGNMVDRYVGAVLARAFGR